MNNTLPLNQVQVQRIIKKENTLPLSIILLMAAVHAVFGLAADRFSMLSTAQAILALAAGLWFLATEKKPDKVLFSVAYIAGAEVFWRMSSASIFHEYGKYASSLLLILAIIKWRRKIRGLPFLYFLLLTPSIILTLFAVDLSQARQEISANLSGPFALAVAVIFFTRYKMSRSVLMNLLTCLVFPVISIAAVALYSILSAETIVFSTSSNLVTSGGYGPNQVSAALGLGALASWIIILLHKKNAVKITFAFIFLWLSVQAALTFSRGGVLNLVIAMVPVSIALYKNLFRRFSTFILVLAAFFLVYLVVLPKLEIFTQGALEQRYADTNLTNRGILIQGDFTAFEENPIFGVGPGMASIYYQRFLGVSSASHTEYTRLLGEHGIFGVISLLLLLAILVQTFFYNRTWAARGMVLAFALWSLAEMTHAAMRIEAISFLIGLSTCLFFDQSNRKLQRK